jgi:polyhydroxybutyrate depolymerase
MSFAGISRIVLVHLPPATLANAPRPLILNLHGSQSTAAAQEAFSGMDATADANGFIVAYPQAAIVSRTGFDWNVPGAPLAGGQSAPKNPPDDVAFLKKLPSELATRYCIDLQRVYVTGFSGGGRMTSQLACVAGDVFAAFAPVSGLRFPVDCQPARPDALLAFHGTADPIDPYNGNGQPYWTESVPAAAAQWGALEQCSANPAVSSPAPNATLTAFSNCEAGASIAYYTIAGLGHEWPGGPTMPKRITRELGPQSNAVNASAAIWAFFKGHALRTA